MIITAQQNPRNMLPVSPMKMDAGLKLNGTNPSTAPRSARASTTRVPSMFEFWADPVAARCTARKRNPAATIAVTPPHRPSKPSIRFAALQQPTTSETTRMLLSSITNQSAKNACPIIGQPSHPTIHSVIPENLG